MLVLLVAASATGAPGKRIVGGTQVAAPGYSFMTALEYRGELVCGASLISSTQVLTAAHCAAGLAPDDLRAVVGARDLAAGDGTRVRIARIAVHPDNRPRKLTNDVALLELAHSVPDTPVDLVGPGDEDLWQPGDPGIVMGWGQTSERGHRYPTILRQATVPFVSDAKCEGNGKGWHRFFDPKSMVCAGGQGKDHCYGDSGGPLVVTPASGGILQAGVVSWGAHCGKPGVPGVYARVAALRDFILEPNPTWAPFSSERPTVTGKPKVGHTLRCIPGAVEGTVTTKAFSWYRMDGGEPAPLPGQRPAHGHDRAYRLKTKDNREHVGCAYRVANSGGYSYSFSRAERIGG